MRILDQLRNEDRRLRWLSAGILLGMLVLVGGLWRVQIFYSRKYQTSLETQTYRTVRIPALRGKIQDRNGLILAENRPEYSVDLYIEDLKELFDRTYARLRAGRRLKPSQRLELRAQARYTVVSNTVDYVARVMGEPISIAQSRFQRHHDQWPYRPMTILKDLTPQQIARMLEQAPNLPGVELEIRPMRLYPQGSAVAHLLGYLTRDDTAREEDDLGFNYSLPTYQGAVGIEYALEKHLSGKAGLKNVVVNCLCYRESETIWIAPQPGHTVRLTIDLPLQKAAYAALRSAGESTRGAVVVLDTSNGDVLAMVSSPAYDPNEFVAGISKERWDQGLNDPELRPMLNRATQGAYQPGSIFKIVTALACLESGVLTPATITDPLSTPGYFMLGRRRIKDTAEAGEYDFKKAFKKSSNTYFIHHGLRAGRDQILDMAHRFHLGEQIGLGMRQEVRGYVPKPGEAPSTWGEGNTANLCIGQEITVTPLQMAVMTAAIANGGRVLYPRFVDRVEAVEPVPDQPAMLSVAPRLRSDLQAKARHLEIIRDAMLADTEEVGGTGYDAFHQRDKVTPWLKGFRVGGKTGTAQVTDAQNRVKDHITWFASFGPYENPRFAVVVMIESGGSGGGTCAPVARQVFQAIQKRTSPPTPQAQGIRLANAH